MSNAIFGEVVSLSQTDTWDNQYPRKIIEDLKNDVPTLKSLFEEGEPEACVLYHLVEQTENGDYVFEIPKIDGDTLMSNFVLVEREPLSNSMKLRLDRVFEIYTH